MLFVVALALAPAVPQEAAASGGGIPVLIVSGANNHDWQWTTPALRSILEGSGKFAVEVTEDPAAGLASAEGLRRHRAIVLNYNGPRWGEPAESSFLAAVRDGVGVVVVHAANNAFDGWVEYERLVGHCWREGTGHGRFHSFDVRITDRGHPVTRDLPDLRAHPDELYHNLKHMHGAAARVLATAYSAPETGGTGKDEPMIMVLQYGKGRVFHTPLGHVWAGVPDTRASFQDPQFQELIVRGTEWAATGEVTPPRAGPGVLSERERLEGWRTLFDGRTSAGWRGYRGQAFPRSGWTVEDGCLHVGAGGGGGDIVTAEEFGDFDLQFEWKVAPGANSGVIYRVGEQREASWQTGLEYQILDDAAHPGTEPKHSAAALYDLVAPEQKALRPAGEFNEGRIYVRGDRVEHWLNGVRVLEARLSGPEWEAVYGRSKFTAWPGFGTLPRGRIALQDHGDDLWFRNIRIREVLPVRPGQEIPLFNGRDLSGWTWCLPEGARPQDVWSVAADGVLVCRGQPEGYIRTLDDYTNFVLKLEWRWSPVTKQAGNSGVLVRMVGPDVVWPRSIEAQLQSGSAGDFWNIGDFPMKTDPARTRGRNTKHTKANERPLGEWNDYEITVDHGTVTLKVNGEVLNAATDCWEVPGKICLQSEGAEIQFRNIRLTPLE